MKLYIVELVGFKSNSKYNNFYVISEDSHAAYSKVLSFLNDKNIGFQQERELETIKLIAEDCEYPNCGQMLFL